MWETFISFGLNLEWHTKQVAFPRQRCFCKKFSRICKRCAISISSRLNNTRGTRYVEVFSFLLMRPCAARPHRFSAFPVFHSTLDLISDSASKNEKVWYRWCLAIDSKPPNIPHSVPSGGPWGVPFDVSRFMDTCYTPRSNSDAKFFW